MSAALFTWKRMETGQGISFPVFSQMAEYKVSCFYSVGNENWTSFPVSFPSRFLFPIYRRETGNEA